MRHGLHQASHVYHVEALLSSRVPLERVLRNSGFPGLDHVAEELAPTYRIFDESVFEMRIVLSHNSSSEDIVLS